jgi:G3E family GTPase
MGIKADIFSGFLGAGKTSLIRKLIEEGCYSGRTAIIENEFGDVSIDGFILRNTDITIKELSSGCICCSITGDFQDAIREIVRKHSPQQLILEPSGLGRLSEVIKAFTNRDLGLNIDIRICATVIDVLRFELYISNFADFYRNQIIHAKTLILSRTQAVGKDKIARVVESLRKLNPDAAVITTPWERLSGEQIMEIASHGDTFLDSPGTLDSDIEIINIKGRKTRLNLKIPAVKKAKERHYYRADEAFDVWSAETVKSFSEEGLRAIFDAVMGNDKPYGEILRGKGIVSAKDGDWLLFQYVPGELIFEGAEPYYTGRICIIGRNLDKSGLAKLFGTI